MSIVIKLDSLKCMARVGETQEERAYPQPVELDMSLDVDVESCLKSDSMADTVDYMKLVGCIETVVKEQSWTLVEKMAFDIMSEIYKSFSAVDNIEISLAKDVLPNGHAVTVELDYDRDDWEDLCDD